MGVFDQMLTNLVAMDFFQVLFPFLLALAIFYGVLRSVTKDKIDKGPIGLISIVLAFFVMLFAKQIPLLSWFLTLGSGTILAISTVVIFIVIVLGLMDIKLSEIWKEGEKRNWTLIIVVIIVIYIILSSLLGVIPGFNMWLPWFFNYQDAWTIIIFILLIAIVLHFLTKEEGGKKPEGPKPPGT
jgi:membrane protease YdiL (CAAX protease family)